MGIAQDESLFGEATADMPKCCGERAACLALWTIPPVETDQSIPGLGPVTMEDQVGQ
jgi:hypothetical protein